LQPAEGDRDKEGWEGALRGRQAEKEVGRKRAASVAQQMMTFLGNIPYRRGHALSYMLNLPLHVFKNILRSV